MLNSKSALVLCALLLTSANPAGAITMFTATLDGSQENPPVASTATGFGSFTLNDVGTALTYTATVFGIDFTGSQTPGTADNLVAAHIHTPGPRGVNGPVAFGFFGTPFNETTPNEAVTTPFTTGVGGTVSGKWDALEGNNTTLTAQLASILAGNSYINFHTMAFPTGEIRGQIEVVPEPGTLMLLGSGLAAVAGAAWRRRRRG
jgi:hypothetical protein